MNTTISTGLDRARAAVAARGLFSSLCTIKRPIGTLDASGEPDLTLGNAVAVTGMVDIGCMAAAETLQRPDVTDETKLMNMTLQRSVRHVLLNGYYPLILQSDFAVIDGVGFEVLTVEPDSQHTTTRMAVQVRTT